MLAQVVRGLGLAVLLANLLATEGVAAERPNVLFLLADDLRADTLGALGHPIVQTPNLDQLARRGVIFRNAYCLGGNSPAVCLPSRNMLLSGRAYFRWQGPYAPADRPNFPTSMKDAGYVAYHHGKRGNVAVEIQKRFDENHILQDEKERTSGQPGKTVIDGALDFLHRRDASKPFFMYLAFEAPHDPRVAAPEFRKPYEARETPLPRNFLPLHPFDNGEMTVRDEKLAAWPRTEAEIRQHLRDYHAVITGLDYHIGRLLRRLDDLDLSKNTLIIFSSDNGLAIGSHGLMGKQSLYDHSMKVPLLFAGPGVPRGESSALVYLHDLYPTVLEMIGATIPQGLDGQSFAREFTRDQAKGGTRRESLFLAYRDEQRAVRDARWKLIRYPKLNKSQLFDLSNDPDEMHDLAANPAHAAEMERLMELMKDWQRQLGDATPLSTEKPRRERFVPPETLPKK